MEILFSFAKIYGIPGLCLAGVILAIFKLKDKVDKTDCSEHRKIFYEESKANAVLFGEMKKDLQYIIKQLDSMNGKRQ